MSNLRDKDKIDDAGFCWGKKRERGGREGEVYFESFTYDGVEYFLYDCVYIYKDGELDPYIGKLIKIWEHPDKGRRVLVLWFFRPGEISNYLRCEKVLENELFLACGDGVGLTNENHLEAIAGKCNVVCISEDVRNRQPSYEEVLVADFIFRRTFDVGSFTISDKLGEKISAIGVRFLLNQKDIRVSDHATNCKADKPDPNRISLLVKEDEGADLLDKFKSLENRDDAEPNITCPAPLSASESVPALGQKTRLKSSDCNEAYVDNVGKSLTNVARTGVKRFSKSKGSDSVNALDKKVKEHGKNDDVDSVPSTSAAHKEKSDFRKNFSSCPGTDSGQRSSLISPGSNKNFLDNVAKSASNIGIPGYKGFGKAKHGDSVDLSDEKAKKNLGEKAVIDSDTNCVKDSIPSISSADRGKSKFAKDSHCSVGTLRKVKSHFNSSEGSLSKKLKLDNTPTPSCKNRMNGTHELDSALIVGEMGSQPAALKAETSVMNEKGSRPAAVIARTDGEVQLVIESNTLSKELESAATMGKSYEKSLNARLKTSKDAKLEANKQVKEVPRRALDKSSWFNPVPWEQRMKDAQDEGRLILLQNLDPAYTSSEVEEMILQAFGERCTAKMVQHTAVSSPHSGQAFAAFKTRGAAERMIDKLKKRCLMLPYERPLVSSLWKTSSDGQQSQFPGHLVIGKLQRQTQRESVVSTLQKAVSTSHSSQSNTIEYELALDWRLLQDKVEFCLKKLNKLQEEDMKKLTSRLRQKKQIAAK